MRRNKPSRPPSWTERQAQIRKRWTLPFVKLDWWMDWAAWALDHWAFLEILESLGTFSVLVAVIFYFAGSGDRTRQRHYAAWLVINSAQGKGGSGGRIEALQELNQDRVSLTGLDGSMAFLRGVQLSHAMLTRCSFQEADLRQSIFHSADLTFCNLRAANFRNADLVYAELADADLTDSDLNGADLESADLARVDLTDSDLRNADLRNIRWQQIASLRLANIFGVRNAPDGFVAFALAHGAVNAESDEQWTQLQNAAKP